MLAKGRDKGVAPIPSALHKATPARLHSQDGLFQLSSQNKRGDSPSIAKAKGMGHEKSGFEVGGGWRRLEAVGGAWKEKQQRPRVSIKKSKEPEF